MKRYLILFLLAWPLLAQLGTFDGNTWKKLGTVDAGTPTLNGSADRTIRAVKMMFVIGYMHGADAGTFAALPNDAEEKKRLHLFQTIVPLLKPLDIVDALDRFYSDQKTLDIPIGAAMIIIAGKQK